MGRTKLIKTPEELKALWEAYKKDVNDNPIKVQDFVGKEAVMIYREKQRPYSMAGFEVYCFELVSCINQYFDNADGRYDNYITICSHIRKEIRNHQIDGGMAGIFNASITQRLNGLTDKQEISQPDAVTEMRVTIVKGKKR